MFLGNGVGAGSSEGLLRTIATFTAQAQQLCTDYEISGAAK
jgi:hypothetical protein